MNPTSRMIIGLGLFLVVSWPGTAEPTRAKIRVLTSLPAIYSWASGVGGDDVQVESLLPENVGPHDFQFRPRDLERLRNADLILLNGAGLEDWLKPVLELQVPKAKGRVREMAMGFPASELLYDSSEGGRSGNPSANPSPSERPNPHLWLDPIFARHGVSNILEALCDIAPESSDRFCTNASVYLTHLIRLDREYQEFRKPLKRPELVTFHAAFPYLCRRYQLKIAGVVEETPGVEPGPRRISQLLATVRERSLDVLFIEPQFDARLVHQLARDMSISVAELDTLETGDWSLEFYEAGMTRNLKVLTKYLK